jgi:hypothetical protein
MSGRPFPDTLLKRLWRKVAARLNNYGNIYNAMGSAVKKKQDYDFHAMAGPLRL